MLHRPFGCASVCLLFENSAWIHDWQRH